MSYKTVGFDNEIVRLLRNGAVGLLPSDTIYGLSCRAVDRSAVERLHRIKRRDKSKPFVILISSMEQLNGLGVSASDAALALPYWPGKLTMILPAGTAPEWLHMGTMSLALRRPDYPQLLKLIDKTGPIVSTSANLSGGQPASTAVQAESYFGDKLDFYVDTGELSGQPSTIVRPSFGKLQLIRDGAVKI